MAAVFLGHYSTIIYRIGSLESSCLNCKNGSGIIYRIGSLEISLLVQRPRPEIIYRIGSLESQR